MDKMGRELIATLLVEEGLRPLPVRPMNKIPLESSWQNRRYKSTQEVLSEFGPNDNLGIVISLFENSPEYQLLIIDYDDLSYLEEHKKIPELQKLFNSGTPIVETASGGWHVWVKVRTENPIRKWKFFTDNGIHAGEVLGIGSFSMCPPSITVPKKGSPYEDEPEREYRLIQGGFGNITQVTLEGLQKFYKKKNKWNFEVKDPNKKVEIRKPPSLATTGGAIEYACNKILSAPEGTVNDTINEMSYFLGRIKSVNHNEAKQALETAVSIKIGGREEKAFDTISRGLADGATNPIHDSIPTSRPPADVIKEASSAILEDLSESIPEMKVENLPPLVKRYVDEIAKSTSGSPTTCAVSLVSALGAFAGTNMVFRNYFGHNLYPNLWCVAFAPSGAFKSTMVKAGTKLVAQYDSRLHEQIKQAGMDQRKLSPKSAEYKEADEITRQLQGQTLKMPERVTLDALYSEFQYRSKGLWLPDEFSTWLKMLTAGFNEGMKSLLTELYEVDRSHTKNTKTGGVEVMRNPFISIVSTSTLEFVQDIISPQDAKTGFLARFLLFRTPRLEIIPPALPSVYTPIEDTSVFGELMRISDILSEMPQTAMTFEKVAAEFFTEWHNQMHREIQSMKENQHLHSILQAYSSRWSPSFIKVAMIFQQILEPGSREITEDAVLSAGSFMNHSIISTRRLFEHDLGIEESVILQRKILELMATHEGTMKWKAISRSGIVRSGKAKDYKDVIESLEESGRVHIDRTGPKQDWVVSLTM
jgi:hypothetical protein